MIIFSINYETDKSTYRLICLAESREDAVGYITWRMGAEPGFKITSVEQREIIHAVTPKLMDTLRPVTNEKIEVKQLICPWCESTEYGSPHALKMHIVKAHADSKETKTTKDAKKK